MKYKIILAIMLIAISKANAQELFLLSYPASNVSKNTLAVRGMSSFFERTADKTISYHFMPELEYGVSKKLMIVANGFISNEENKVKLEGASILGQYRFYTNDDVKKHFRMAVWSRLAINSAEIHQQEIELNGHNTGIRLGLTGTQLLHKTALSTTLSYQKALSNIGNKFPLNYTTSAVDYTFAIGQLILPKQYKNFNQTNVNLMLEVLGQSHTQTGKTFVDIAPVVQFIFKSKIRLDIAYRRQLYSSIFRTQPNGIIINLQYNIFNFLKK